MSGLHTALRKYSTAGLVSMRNRLAYPAAFAGSLLTYGLFVFVFSRIWAAVYSGRVGIAGYDRPMMVWYFIVAEISVFGFGRFYSTLSEDIKSGQVAYLLARPYGFTAYHFSQTMGHTLGDCLVLAAEGFLLGRLLGGPVPVTSLAQGAVLVLSILLAGCLQFYLQFAIAMTAFWLEENAAVYWIYQKLALVIGTFLPLEFLPKAVESAAKWTPFPYLSWAPARIAVAWEPGEGLRLLAFQAAWTAAAALLCRGVFAAGRGKITVNGG
jgi:ABC-2 type transport system permease protein